MRSLRNLAEGPDQRKRWFAFEYAGHLQTVTPPHSADWKKAEQHWIRFNTDVLDSDFAAEKGPLGRLRAAEDAAILILWYLVRAPRRTCPRCIGSDPRGGSGPLDPDEIRRLVREAKEYLDRHPEIHVPPDLAALMASDHRAQMPAAHLVVGPLHAKFPSVGAYELLQAAVLLVERAGRKEAQSVAPRDLRALERDLATTLGVHEPQVASPDIAFPVVSSEESDEAVRESPEAY